MFAKFFSGHLVLFAFLFCAFIQGDGNLSVIAEKLNHWHDTHPQEKVYLHLSSSIFLSGDTLYCKAYVVDADVNIPSSLSQVVYVDMIDNNDNRITSLTLPVQDGTARGAMALSNLLPSGKYHIRAYTSWMRNFNSAFFFDKAIVLINSSDKQSLTSSVRSGSGYRTDFFPEGGQLVSGLPSRLAFKAVNRSGHGIAITGKIMDEAHSLTSTFKSGFSGMGSCILTLSIQHTYTAFIRYQDGSEEQVALPRLEPAGYVLSVDNMDDEKIKIQVAGKDMPEEVMLLAQSHSYTQYSQILNLVAHSSTIYISKRKFPTGITQFTLFTKEGIPVAERLIFINRNDQMTLQSSLEQTTYGKRQKVRLRLHAIDELDEPLAASLSVSVTENSTVPVSAHKGTTIGSYLWLTSDLTGPIESPDYYFTDIDSNKVRDLDNLLLTQGWRRFLWKEVLTDQHSALPYPADKGLSLTGKVTKNGKLQPDAAVIILTKNSSASIAKVKTDASGNFSFDNLSLPDGAQIVVQAVNEGNENMVLSVNRSSAAPTSYRGNTEYPFETDTLTINGYALANKKRWEERKKYGLISDSAATLREVVVNTTLPSKIKQVVAPSANLNGPGNADQVITYNDLPNCHDLSMCLAGKLVGVQIKRKINPDGSVQTDAFSSSGMDKPMLIIVDGVDQPPSQSSLASIPGNDVQSIEVLRTGAYLSVYGMRAAGGVLIITTKRGNLDYNHLDDQKKTVPSNTSFITFSGYTPYREFYSPQYSGDPTSPVRPDLRSTLYWNPDIVTDDEGNATMEWLTADVTGTYTVLVEGVSKNGRAGAAFATFTVK